jgi:excisionase family DNA binding protein
VGTDINLFQEGGTKMTVHSSQENPAFQLLTASDLAEMLSVTKRSIYRWTGDGTIPKPVKVGGKKIWRSSDIDQWVQWDCPERLEFERRMKIRDGHRKNNR